MGTRNRQRRAEKLRRRQRASTPRTERNDQRFDSPPIREAIYAAASALRGPDRELYEGLLTVLSDNLDVVGPELDLIVGEAVRAVWKRNWKGPEVVRQAQRQLGSHQAGYVTDAIGRDRGEAGWWRPGEAHLGQWAAQERLADIIALACAIEVLALLQGLPQLPRLGPSSGSVRRPSRPGQDTKVLERVRALLAKAESTTFPEEAEALSAKAQELMARYAIDEAMIDAAAGVEDAPGGVRLPIDDPYAGPKSTLLSVVATANGCRSVFCHDVGFSTVMGFESDLEFVEVLYTSLLVQATSAMVAAGSQVDRYGRSRTRSFRTSFLLAYATRIGHRLREAEATSRAEATEVYGAALLPILADRSAAVKEATEAAFPKAFRRAMTISNAAGWAAGAAAADMASLSARTEVPAG